MSRIYPDPVRPKPTRMEASSRFWCGFAGGALLGTFARVHLWYADHFGHSYPRLRNAREAIDRFLVSATCVGIRRNGPDYEVYAPYGLALIYTGALSSNPLLNRTELYRKKAQSYLARWPWLHAEDLVQVT